MSRVSPEESQANKRKAALAWLSGAPKEKCAEIAGVNYSTFYRWTTSPEWTGILESALPGLHQEMVRKARAVLMHHLNETKDAKVAMFVLERLAAAEWTQAERQTSDDDVVIEVVAVKRRNG